MPGKLKYPYQPERDVHRITLYNTVYPEHRHTAEKPRLYGHFDFACFYAQVEQLTRNLYGIPLIIGGWRKEDGTVKGIVATSSYEARSQGIKTGMSAFEAYRICPYIVMLQVDYDRYRAISKQVTHVMEQFSHEVERYSMDEFFLNLTPQLDMNRCALYEYASGLQQAIFETTGLVGAMGIAYSKTYAKLASSLDKPRGISLILNKLDAARHIYPLNLDKVWGVGRRRSEKLRAEGLYTIGDVVQADSKILQRLFGPNFGHMLYDSITGNDQSRILAEYNQYIPKHGVGYGHTFSEGADNVQQIKGEFAIAVQILCYRMRSYGFRSAGFSGYIGFNQPEKKGIPFRFATPAYTYIDDYVYQYGMEAVLPLVKHALRQGREIRNIVIGTHEIDKSQQMNLFFREEAGHINRFKAIDSIKNRYGYGAITTASALCRVPGHTHFVERNG